MRRHQDPGLRKVQAAFRRCAPLFQALGDPHRQSIVLLLTERERLNVGQIAEAMPLSRPAISHHLKVLRQAGLLTVSRESRENVHALSLDRGLAELRRLVELAESSCT